MAKLAGARLGGGQNLMVREACGREFCKAVSEYSRGGTLRRSPSILLYCLFLIKEYFEFLVASKAFHLKRLHHTRGGRNFNYNLT